ncbi:MAG: hypothetical protein J2P17_12450 [Mycobacterium sp.]|nr:hypothetical protein [Mycobacterium sp.]
MGIVTEHPVIDGVLQRYSDALGPEQQLYRNHVYRCFNYQRLLLGAQPPDTAALAWAIHDLGIWTAGTIDYLQPSADLAEQLGSEFGIEDIETVRTMVLGHHRLRRLIDPLIETFRLADRVDVSGGLLRDGVGRRDLRVITTALPYRGFHPYLGWQIGRHAVRHPLRPLPMVRW